jgi:mRNA interferase HigB
MKLHLIKKETIERYIIANARSRPSFTEFLEKLKYADWEKPTDMRATFTAADLLGKSSNRVVFNIGGNTYRMICKYAFGDKQVHLFICWIGTHAEYTAICNEQLQYTISNY